jgi:hypothetical protein
MDMMVKKNQSIIGNELATANISDDTNTKRKELGLSSAVSEKDS